MKAGALEQSDDLRKIDMPVPATEMSRQPCAPCRRPREIDDESPPAGPDDAPQLGDELPAGGPAEVMAAFSLPLLTHIHLHRRAAKTSLGERGRAVLHQHLRRVLSEWIAKTLSEDLRRRRRKRMPVAPELLAQHIASTFVLVLHWWLDRGGTNSPAQADRLFRALVMPVLDSI